MRMGLEKAGWRVSFANDIIDIREPKQAIPGFLALPQMQGRLDNKHGAIL